MVRTATMYHDEGSLENAYILYMKFMTLFLEKIRTHPEFKAYPAAEKRANQERLREVLPVTEKLHARLLERYQTENQLLRRRLDDEAEQRRRRQMAADQMAAAAKAAAAAAPSNADRQRGTNAGLSDESGNGFDMPTAPPPDSMMLDQVVYPHDFPPAASQSAGLLLPPDAGHVMPK